MCKANGAGKKDEMQLLKLDGGCVVLAPEVASTIFPRMVVFRMTCRAGLLEFGSTRPQGGNAVSYGPRRRLRTHGLGSTWQSFERFRASRANRRSAH